MAFKNVLVVDVVRDIVLTIPDIFFENGEGVEVFNTLTKSQTANIKTFPLIYLKQDFKEIYKSDGTVEVTLQLFILCKTKQEWKANQRLKNTFETILIPIYEALINALCNDDRIQVNYGLEFPNHTKWDRLYLGTEKLIGNGFLDCIEIEDLELKIKINNC